MSSAVISEGCGLSAVSRRFFASFFSRGACTAVELITTEYRQTKPIVVNRPVKGPVKVVPAGTYQRVARVFGTTTVGAAGETEDRKATAHNKQAGQ